MLVISLVVCSLMVLLANCSVLYPAKWNTPFFLYGCAASFGFLCVGVFLPPALVLFGLLLVSKLRSLGLVRRRGTYWRYSLVALLMSIAVGFLLSLGEMREWDRLRDKYPLESLEDRVPPRGDLEPSPMSDGTEAHLGELEAWLDHSGSNSRGRVLGDLHDNRIALFARSPGFGVTRMLSLTVQLRIYDRNSEDITEQPEIRAGLKSTFDRMGEIRSVPDADVRPIHRDSLHDFLDPRRFGYFKDRRRVAGFVAHRIRDVRSPSDSQWEVRRIDLVSVLVHPEPGVYVSDELPQMDKLRGVPTRPLDDFESEGLANVRSGEDLVTRMSTHGLRMLGAIRATKQCVQCQACERGDLLGAFSYDLQPAPKY